MTNGCFHILGAPWDQTSIAPSSLVSGQQLLRQRVRIQLLLYSSTLLLLLRFAGQLRQLDSLHAHEDPLHNFLGGS